MATAGTSRDVSSSFTSTKIAHFGPSGLFSDALPGCFGAVGHDLVGAMPGSGQKPEPAELMLADVILLWVPPQPPTQSLLDDMHAILVLLNESEWQGRPKRIILVSNLLTWGSCSQLGKSCSMNLAKKSFSEDDYLKRRSWPSCEGLMELEAHVLRLDGSKLHTCVIAAGAIYGAGEESFTKMFTDAYNFISPLILPSPGENVLPTVHIGVLCAFLCWLIDNPEQRFPKQYMLACEPGRKTVTDIANAVASDWELRVTKGAFARTNLVRSGTCSAEEGAILAEAVGAEFEVGKTSYNQRNASMGNINGNGNSETSKCANIREFKGILEGCQISFNYPASIMLALDCAGLDVEQSVFNKALNSSRIVPFASAIGSGMVANVSEVVDEFIVSRSLLPYHIWILRQPGDAVGLCSVAKFISRRLQLPRVESNSCISWIVTQQHQVDGG